LPQVKREGFHDVMVPNRTGNRQPLCKRL
jgi:hypothetical protein